MTITKISLHCILKETENFLDNALQSLSGVYFKITIYRIRKKTWSRKINITIKLYLK